MNPCSEEEYFHKLDNMVIQSTQYLRQIFKTRWKFESGEEWKDEENYIRDFLSHHCKHILKQAIPVQKKILLESCSLEDWDISLMSLVLLNFGDGKKFKFHDKAIRQLKNLRNDLAHHKSKKIKQSEFCEKLKVFKECLQMFEVSEFEIDKLIEESSVSSSLEAIERAKVLMQNADQLMNIKEYQNALKQYSEALSIPGLLSVNLGKLYEKRAACYLGMKDETNLNGQHTDQALLDIEQALQLNQTSWNAHYLKAQCHRNKNNLPEAARFYEMALAISPTQKQIKQDLDSLKLLNDVQKINARLNLDHLPISLSDQVRQMEIDSGFGNLMQSIVKEQSEFPGFLGDLYYHGWEVPQNYEKAMHYYTIADKQGDAEGCLKIAIAYLHGHGVEHDVTKGFEMLKRCAGMNPKQPGRFEQTPLGFNQFVAAAENNIGKFYEDGLCVEKNVRQAALWYTKAMEHGLGEPATDLGRLFMDRTICCSLLKSEKMAEMCWKQGIIFHSSRSAEFLVDYYRCQLEPEMAWIMLNIAREMGSTKYLEMTDEEFSSRDLALTSSERLAMEKCLTFEKRQNLGFKGMTWSQRILRMEKHTDPTHTQFRTCGNFGGQLQSNSIHDMSDVRLKAASGSQTASKIVETVDMILKLNELLEIENDFSKVYKLAVVNLYYACMSQQNHLVSFMTNANKFGEIVAEMFTKFCEQIGEDEMKIRFCYLSHNLRQTLKSPDDLYAIGILKEGLRRYPDNYGYYCILIECLKTRKSWANALQHVYEALDKFSEKIDLLYEKADIVLRAKGRKSCAVISVLKSSCLKHHGIIDLCLKPIMLLAMLTWRII